MDGTGKTASYTQMMSHNGSITLNVSGLVLGECFLPERVLLIQGHLAGSG